MQRWRQKSKYNSEKITIDGITFDSRKEGRRFRELKLLESRGLIKDLELQKKFILIPAQREPDSVGKRGGKIRGKLIERELSYFADFYYFDAMSQEWICEDAKGFRTPEYIVKRKLMLWLFGIRIHEV